MPEQIEGYVSLKDAAKQIGCSKALLQKMIYEGVITPLWVGGIQVITSEDVEIARERYLKNKRGE